jgi:hypothetical protein
MRKQRGTRAEHYLLPLSIATYDYFYPSLSQRQPIARRHHKISLSSGPIIDKYIFYSTSHLASYLRLPRTIYEPAYTILALITSLPPLLSLSWYHQKSKTQKAYRKNHKTRTHLFHKKTLQKGYLTYANQKSSHPLKTLPHQEPQIIRHPTENPADRFSYTSNTAVRLLSNQVRGNSA